MRHVRYPKNFFTGDERFLQVQLQEGLVDQMKQKLCQYPEIDAINDELSCHAQSVAIHARNISADHNEVMCGKL